MTDANSLSGHNHDQNRFAAIPTADKLSADPRFSGRGVRVAFLDSGFFPHPDFAGRVVEFHDVEGEEGAFHAISAPRPHHWHGTQTVAVCAGDGSLSNGIYRGLASAAELVLVKVSRRGRISDASIEDGLRWVLERRDQLRTRVLNVSLGGDRDAPTNESGINRLVEELTAAGVCVTVAAGNSAAGPSIPPASAPSAVTVGGFSDRNAFAAAEFELYHSNFGRTIDGLVKPELIAPAMYVAAPILPETDEYRAAEALSHLANAPGYALPQLLERHWLAAGLPKYPSFDSVEQVQGAVDELLRSNAVVAAHYKHVDGTSFAAPIVASVIAQMLEANPDLTPAVVKNILVTTARKLPRHEAVRQGFGVVNAPEAVRRALAEAHFLNPEDYRSPQIGRTQIVFTYHDDDAECVALAGDFNGWRTGETRFRRCADGIWRARIDRPPTPGIRRYKFLVDGRRWTEDPSHGLKEDDGFGGFNSLLVVPAATPE